MKLVGANPSAKVGGLGELPGKSNYFIGSDQSKWRTRVPSYKKVEYRDIYPGINLIYYGNQDQLEYDFVVTPEADPELIRLSFEGCEKVRISEGGDLIISIAGGEEISFHKPHIYQEVNGLRRAISGDYRLIENPPSLPFPSMPEGDGGGRKAGGERKIGSLTPKGS